MPQVRAREGSEPPPTAPKAGSACWQARPLATGAGPARGLFHRNLASQHACWSLKGQRHPPPTCFRRRASRPAVQASAARPPPLCVNLPAPMLVWPPSCAWCPAFARPGRSCCPPRRSRTPALQQPALALAALAALLLLSPGAWGRTLAAQNGEPGPPEVRVGNKRIFLPKHAAAGGPGAKASITYHGGPVMLGTVNVYFIWYGNSWASDAAGQDVLVNLANSIGASPWYNITTTYKDGASNYCSPSVAYKGSVTAAQTLGTSLTDANIWTLVSMAVQSGNLGPTAGDPKAIYFVLTASNITASSGFCSQYCGWHDKNVLNGATLKYSFVGNAAVKSPSSCLAKTVKLTASLRADGMASVLAHELTEAVTDPELNAWYDRSGYENADKCAWTFGTTTLTTNGAKTNMKLGAYNYLIQQNWLASTQKCGLSR